MAIGHHKYYEVHIRLNGYKLGTRTFHKREFALSFIDNFIMDRLQNGYTTVFIKDGWKIFIVSNEGLWYTITIVEVERQFMMIDDFLKCQNN